MTNRVLFILATALIAATIGLVVVDAASAPPDGRRAIVLRVSDDTRAPRAGLTLQACSAEGEYRFQAAGETGEDGRVTLRLPEECCFVYVLDPEGVWVSSTTGVSVLDEATRARLHAGPAGRAAPTMFQPVAVVGVEHAGELQIELTRRVVTQIRVRGRAGLPRMHARVEAVDRDHELVYDVATTDANGLATLRLPPGRSVATFLYTCPARAYPLTLDPFYRPRRALLGEFVSPSSGQVELAFEQDEWPVSTQLVPVLTDLAARGEDADLTLLVLAQQLDSISHREPATDALEAASLRAAVERVVALLPRRGGVSPEVGEESPVERFQRISEAGRLLSEALDAVYASSLLAWRGFAGREAYGCVLWTALQLNDQSPRAKDPERNRQLAAALCELLLEWNDEGTWMRESAARRECAVLLERATRELSAGSGG